jgi:hypothetical protein
MNLSQYVNDLRQHLMVAARAGGEEASELAERLTAPLEAATRLVLLEALSAAASEITCELAPGSVDLRLRGSEPEFVVTPAPTRQLFDESPDAANNTSATPVATSEADEGGTSRLTLRLPEQLKVRMEEVTSREGLSVNAWLVRAVVAALDNKSAVRRDSFGGEDRFTGWVG